MNPWLSPWLNMYKWPLSGNVNQDINPVTSWMSPKFEINLAGDQYIESEVVSEIASYGKQLGILSEAVLEIANGKEGEAIDKLKALNEKIHQVKQKRKTELVDKARDDLEQLKQSNPDALQTLLNDFRRCN